MRRLTFFATHPALRAATPTLASAFYLRDVPYRWRRGVRHAIG